MSFFRKFNLFGWQKDNAGVVAPVRKQAITLLILALLGGGALGRYGVPNTVPAVTAATKDMVSTAAAATATEAAVTTAKGEAVKGMMLISACDQAKAAAATAAITAQNCGRFITPDSCNNLEGVMLTSECTPADEEHCSSFVTADACADIEGVLTATACETAKAEAATAALTAEACTAKFPPTPAPPVVAPQPPAPTAGKVVVTFTGKPDGTMDWGCPACPAGTTASGSPQGIVLALSADKRVTCPNPPRLAAGVVFTADCQ